MREKRYAMKSMVSGALLKAGAQKGHENNRAMGFKSPRDPGRVDYTELVRAKNEW